MNRKLLDALIISVAASILVGCANTSGLSASVDRLGFDGSTVVDMPMHATSCALSSASCLGLGFQWSSVNASSVIVRASYIGDYVAITGAELSVDGQKISMEKVAGPTAFSRPGEPLRISTAGFVMPLAAIRSASLSSRVWLRVHTSTGYVDDYVVSDGSDSKALHALRRFLASTDEAMTKK